MKSKKSKKYFYIIVIILTVVKISLAQNSKKRLAYIEKYKNIAIREMKIYNIPASITLAQGILESADGKSKLATKSNNHFGIKCHQNWKGERVYHDDDQEGECFRKYSDPLMSYRDHSEFLQRRKYYKELFDLDIKDYKGWAHGLKKAGYATLPTYAEKLINIIEVYKLYKYDSMTLTEEQDKLLAKRMDKAKKIKGSNMERINTLRYILATTSLEEISNKVKIPVAFLMEYNDLESSADLQQNQIVYLERKKIRANEDDQIHIVKSGDTLYSISQKYGIRLKWLCKRNEIKKDVHLKQGTKVYLRDFKPIERI